MPLLAQTDLQPAATGLRAITEANGLGITVTGLLIVFVALTAISLFIGLLPKALAALGPWLPEIECHHDQPVNNGRAANGAGEAPVDGPLAAAIAWAVHASRQKG